MTLRGSFYRSDYCWAADVIWRLLSTVGDRCGRLVVLILVLSLSMVPAARAQTAVTGASPASPSSKSPQGAAAAPLPASPDEQAIPLPKIADQAEELDRLLREISGEMPPTSELLEAERLA